MSLIATRASAQENKLKDRSQWADIEPRVRDWYKNQNVTPETHSRLHLPFWSCCDNGDVFRTRFRLINDGSKYGAEGYEYEKDGTWHIIPPDIVQRKPTPTGKPVLFVRQTNGTPLCFIIDKEGI